MNKQQIMNNQLDHDTALQISYRRFWLSNQIVFLNITRTLNEGDKSYLSKTVQQIINYQVEYQAIAVLLRANGYQNLISVKGIV